MQETNRGLRSHFTTVACGGVTVGIRGVFGKYLETGVRDFDLGPQFDGGGGGGG